MKLGDEIRILERTPQYKYYSTYKIIKIYDKKLFNMYLCENIKTKCKTTFTDKDLKSAERTYRKSLDLVEVDI